MGATTSTVYSGAIDATVATVVSGAASSITRTYEVQEEIDVTLYSLQQEVMKIQCAINAARRRRITDRQLLMWLASLIDAVYLGNYYLRIFKSWNSHSQMITRGGANNLTISPSYREVKRPRTIKTLIFGDEEIKELYNTFKMLKSIDVGTFMLMVNAEPERPIKIYLYMDQNRLVHRDKEREEVMTFLFEPNMEGVNNVDILLITGSSGGGKTSFSLHCFYDPKVQGHFSLKFYYIWSYIAYDEFRAILKYMLEKCNATNITNDDDNTLIAMLKQNLSTERFLLIMDCDYGVDSKVWNILWDCLRCGKRGSRVILISDFNYYNDYKKIIHSREVKTIIVDGFSEDEYMTFFKEHAFGSSDPEEYPELAEIGREIAKELGGSIWGAKIFGELLRDNLNAEFWSYLQDALLSFQTYSQRKEYYFFAVLRVIFQLLSKCLPPVKNLGLSLRLREEPTRELKSYGELIIGPDHGTPAIEKERNLGLSFRQREEPIDELKSYRELMVLGRNHCTPVVKEGRNRLDVLVTKQISNIFLNKYTIFEALFTFD